MIAQGIEPSLFAIDDNMDEDLFNTYLRSPTPVAADDRWKEEIASSTDAKIGAPDIFDTATMLENLRVILRENSQHIWYEEHKSQCKRPKARTLSKSKHQKQTSSASQAKSMSSPKIIKRLPTRNGKCK